MIDQNMQRQVRELFAKLQQPVELIYAKAEHQKQEELVQMLETLASLSDLLDLKASSKASSLPSFEVKGAQTQGKVLFTGVPGGHEFSSLVLAILHADGQGRFPDKALQARIKALKGPAQLKTYISLSCENCPDVVQALNIMAVLNPNIEHQMIDGDFVPEQVEQLNIQGVPSVIFGETLLSSGKASFVDLLERLEKHLGVDDTSESQNSDLGDYDVVIVGAGPAGASSAIYTARKGLKTAVITDRLGGQLQETKGIENFVSVPYTEGPELSSHLHKHMGEYDIDVFEHRRVSSVNKGSVKSIQLTSGEQLNSKALIVATGAKWRELGVPGEKDYLGKGVAFCPHCDGPYYKGKDIAVIGGGNSGVEAAIDLAGIVKSVTVLEFLPELKADEVLVKQLQSLNNVRILKNVRTDEVLGDGQKVTALRYEQRDSGELQDLPLDGVFVQIGLVPNSEFVKDIVNTNPYGEIEIDLKCRTSEPGIYAAGDVSTVPYKQIIVSMGEGAKAGLAAFEDLKIKS